MAFFKKKPATIDDLAVEYVTWKGRQEVLEAERPALHAAVMGLEQDAMEGEGDSRAMEEADKNLSALDRKIEAAAAKLAELYQLLGEAVAADIEARRLEIPKIEASLAAECQAKSNEAARLFAAGVRLAYDLGIDLDSVVKILGHGQNTYDLHQIIDRMRAGVLADAYDQVRPEHLTHRDPGYKETYTGKLNQFLNFKVITGGGIGHKDGFIRQKMSDAIQAAGGTPPPMKFFHTVERSPHGKF